MAGMVTHHYNNASKTCHNASSSALRLAGHIKVSSFVLLVPQTENLYLCLIAVNGTTQIKCSMSQSCKKATPFFKCALERPSEKNKMSDSPQACFESLISSHLCTKRSLPCPVIFSETLNDFKSKSFIMQQCQKIV